LKNWLLLDALQGMDMNSPDAMSPTVKAWQENLQLVRTIYGGWQELYTKRAWFLPQHPKEDPQDYLIRARRPTFYNAFARTVRALSGAPFSKPPETQGIPADVMKLYVDDIDNEGTSGDQFVRHAFQDGLVTGLVGIFVNMPALEVAEGQEVTRADELAAGIRPFWELVRMDDIVSFLPVVENGKVLLAQLVFKDRRQEQSGKFGVKVIERLRIYRRVPNPALDPLTIVAWEAWERDQKSQKWVPVASGQLPTVTEIPLAQIYTERTDFMDATPPLLDLANINLLHYQIWSDLAHAAHIANVPFLFGGGFDSQELQIGPNRAIIIAGAKRDEAWLSWLETTGASLGSTRAILGDLEEQMATLGLGMLQRKSRAAETAQKAALDRRDQESTLDAAVSDLENGLEQALYWTAQYLGHDQGGKLIFTRAFDMDPLSSATDATGAPPGPKEPLKPGETNNPDTTMMPGKLAPTGA
jgi:hypothetical protein